jgi:polar amino acid transport system substrate-binding protein
LSRTRLQWLLLLGSAIALLLSACGGGGGGSAENGPAEGNELGLQQPGIIRVGSDIAFQPFEFVEDNENKGFDVDLMNEIASRLGVEAQFVNTGFDGLFTQVANGQFDVGMSAITITEERAQTVAFSTPYFNANQAVVAPISSDIAGPEDFGGKRVGVQAATTGFQYATENFTDAQIVEFPTSEAAFTSLSAGQLDAVFIDTPVAESNVEGSAELELKATVETGEQYGIAVRPGNDALLEAINTQLEEIIADGTYEEIYGRWFDTEVPEEFRAQT